RRRPFASGAIPIRHGLVAIPVLMLASLATALAIGPGLLLALLAYCAMTLGYSFKLKRIVMVDVVMLAALYTVRIVAGALAIDQVLSFWLLEIGRASCRGGVEGGVAGGGGAEKTRARSDGEGV